METEKQAEQGEAAAGDLPFAGRVKTPRPRDPAPKIILGVLGTALLLALVYGALQQQPSRPIVGSTTGIGAASTTDAPPKLELDEETKAWAALSPSAKFAKRIDDELLPSLHALQMVAPTTMPAMWARLGQLEYLARQVLEADGLTFTGSEAAKMAALKKALVEKQVQLYPIYRTAFIEGSRQRLWAQDIAVHGGGRKIEFVGVLFARNANIQAAEEIIEADLRRLRFDRATYRWIKGGDGATYTLESPADREIASP